MKIIKRHTFDQIEAFELGYGYWGRPLMNVYFYFIDGVLIDTAQSLMRKPFIEIITSKDIDKVLLTHFHEDHSGNAAVVKKIKNIPIYGHQETVEKMKTSSTRYIRLKKYLSLILNHCSVLTARCLSAVRK
ncbi:MAG: MBL fold metallo-hydrolase [Pseudomonadota bacterium]